MSNNTYSKDKKQRQEIESARNYNIQWLQKRKNLLYKNWQEMDKYAGTYPWLIYPNQNESSKSRYVYPLLQAKWYEPNKYTYVPIQKQQAPVWLDFLTNNYISNAVKGIQDTKVYGDADAYMKAFPNSSYSKKARAYQEQYNVDSNAAFDKANNLNGLAFKDSTGRRGIYLKQGRSGSAAHELLHASTASTYTLPTGAYGFRTYTTNPQHYAVVKYLIQDPYIQKLLDTRRLNWDWGVQPPYGVNNYNYVWNPDEVLARRATLMHFLNWNPNKRATLKDVQNWRKQGLLNPNNAGTLIKNNPLFPTIPYINLDKLSDQTILHLINDVAINNTPSQDTYQLNDVYYAYKGGLITKLTK